MQQLQIDSRKAKMLYEKGSDEIKEIMVDSFGKEFFSKKIIDRIKTYEDACADLGLDPIDELPFTIAKNARQEAANAFTMLDIISEVLLENAKIDWTDSDQEKWYPYFNNYTSGSGFRFGGAAFGGANAGAGGGARLCLDTQEKAMYFGKQFIDIWNKFLNPTIIKVNRHYEFT